MEFTTDDIEALRSSKILVTGAGGFIGAHFLSLLSEADVPVRALARSRGGAFARRFPKVSVRQGKLGSSGAALEAVDTVVNFAYDVRESAERNLSEFQRFLDAMADAGVQTLVQVSSIVVHEGWPDTTIGPASPRIGGEAGSYRSAKAAIETLIEDAVRSGRLRSAVILRPTLVYGRGSRMWTHDVVRRIRSGPILLPAPSREHPANKPFGLCHIVHVEDLVRVVCRAILLREAGCRAYIISNPEPPSWREFYQAHIEILGKGSVRSMPYGELVQTLPPDDESHGKQGPSLAARLSAIARRIVGNERVDAVGDRLRQLGSGTSVEQKPDRFLFELYASTGSLDVSDAVRDLKFKPEKPFRERLLDMQDTIRRL